MHLSNEKSSNIFDMQKDAFQYVTLKKTKKNKSLTKSSYLDPKRESPKFENLKSSRIFQDQLMKASQITKQTDQYSEKIQNLDEDSNKQNQSTVITKENNENNKEGGEWIPQESINISAVKRKSTKRTSKSQAIGWIPEESIDFGNGNRKSLTPEKNNDIGWLAQESIDISAAKRKSIKPTNEWIPQESIDISAAKRKSVKTNNEWIPQESININQIKRKSEIKQNNEWIPQESININQIKRKSEIKQNNEWMPQESINLNQRKSIKNTWEAQESVNLAIPNNKERKSFALKTIKEENPNLIASSKQQNWGAMESVVVGKNGGVIIQNFNLLNRNSSEFDVNLLQKKNTIDIENNDKKLNQMGYSKKYTLPSNFFSESRNINKNPQLENKKELKLSFLHDGISINTDAFKIIYNKDSIVKTLKINEESKIKIKLNGQQGNRQAGKLIRKATRAQGKEEKGCKGSKLSKLLKINNSVYILIHDIQENLNRMILLDNYKDIPSKFHCFDQYLGYFYIYDNKGTISVYIGNIKEGWNHEKIDEKRKLFDLKLQEDLNLIDPILYVLKFKKNESVLLVIGGYLESNKKILPNNKISVFFISFSGYKGNPVPLFKIKMRYGRINPLICKQKFNGEQFLLVLGGNNTHKIKKEHLFDGEENYDNFKHSLQMVESIKIKTIRDAIFQAQVGSVKEIGMENTLKIGSDHKEFHKMYSFCQGGVIRMKTGKVGEKEGKTNFFIGVGKSKKSIYFIDYFDYKNFSVYISKAFNKMVASGILNNAMICHYNGEIYYLVDDNSESYKKIVLNFGNNNINKTAKCNIF